MGSLKLQVQTGLRGKRYQAKIDLGPVVPGHIGYLLPKQHKLVVGYGPGHKSLAALDGLLGSEWDYLRVNEGTRYVVSLSLKCNAHMRAVGVVNYALCRSPVSESAPRLSLREDVMSTMM